MITLDQYNEAKKIVKEYEKQQSKEPFWDAIVKVWFDWYAAQRIGEKPDFTGSAPKDLKAIVKKIKVKCIEHNLSWTEENAVRTFNQFFNLCLKYQFTSDKLMLSLFNKYFQEITTNGKSKPTKGIDTSKAIDLLSQFAKR